VAIFLRIFTILFALFESNPVVG